MESVLGRSPLVLDQRERRNGSDDELAGVRGEAAAIGPFGRTEVGEEAGHAVGVEAIGFAVDGPGVRAGLGGAFGWGAA
jgi:hypothetical protein